MRLDKFDKRILELLQNNADQALSSLAEIVEFYRMSGEVDYLLKVVAPDIQSFDKVYKQLINKVEIFEISSHFAMEELKQTTELPLNYV